MVRDALHRGDVRERRGSGRDGPRHAHPLHPEHPHWLFADRGRQFAGSVFTTSTGATLSFPNLYADISGIPWLFGGTAWAGTRYYKRESVYISDFFYWNPSGVGAGIEDINLGKDLRLSYAAFAVDGRLVPPPQDFAPPLALQTDFGVRNDLQLRGIKLWESGEFQLGFQYIANYSNNPSTSGGWGVTFRFVQKMLGGDNKFAAQYGRGAGTGFGTLARYYYPDFSLYNDPNEFRIRFVDVLTIQPGNGWFGAQAALVYQHDDLGNAGQVQNWLSAGTRVSVGVTEHFKVLGEVGFDRVTKSNGSPPQYLTKFTIAPTLSTGRGLLTRPELRLFYTWAVWNEAARTATIDSGMLYHQHLSLERLHLRRASRNLVVGRKNRHKTVRPPTVTYVLGPAVRPGEGPRCSR